MDVVEFRKNASLASEGGSDDFIYQSALDYISKILKLYPDKKSILDIGCGHGEFLKHCRELFPNNQLTGCDLTQFDSSWDDQIKWITQDLNQDFSEKFETYDIIASLEVIEHLENPRHFLREIEKYLKKGGHLILSTPNPESLNSLISFILRGYHSDFGPRSYPAHIVPVTAYDLKNMVSELKNMELKEIIYLKNARIPGTAIKWKSLAPFLSGKRFSGNFIAVIRKQG